MPTSVIIALGAAGVSSGLVALGAGTFMAAVAASLTAAVLAAAFAPSPPAAEEISGRLATVREPVSAWQWIYGQVRVGGVITFIGSEGTDNKLLHMVITLAGHEVEEIGDIYFDDILVPLDGSGFASSGRFENRARVLKSTGDEAAGVQPFSALVNAGVGWESADHQTGRAKIYVRLTWNENTYPHGIPNITAIVKGRKVLDPRFSPVERRYSNNAALCIADYLMSAEAGLGCDYDEIDEAELISAANVCDEQVALNAGSPTQYETRYTANGSFFVNQPPREVLPKLLTAIAGQAVFIGGQWKILPGAYRTPTITLGADDLRGTLHIMPRLSKRDLCNGVKGIFVDPEHLYNPTDYPPVVNATYLTEDQEERIWREVDQPFQTSAARAQRIGKIQLEQTRQQITVEWPGKLGCYRLQPGDTVMITLSRYGWTEKVFEVRSSTLTFEEADGGAGVILGCDLVLRETASGVYDWNAGEETTIDLAADTELPDPFADLDIANLTASSGTADLFRQGDGTIVPRVRLRWDEPTNPFLTFYEIQFARVSGSPTEWVDAPDVLIPLTEGFAHPVEDGVVYDLRIRACTSMGNKGEWATVWGHTVVGKTELPSDVGGANAVQDRGLVVMGCDRVPDEDLDSVEVRYHDEGESDWDSATPFTNILRGETSTSKALPPGTWELLFKAKDTSGNYSASVAQVTITVTADGFTTVASSTEGPDWMGTLTHMVRHWTGVLTPESQDTAEDLGWDTFDEFVANAEPDCFYEAPVLDKTIDARARLYGDIVSTLGPGEANAPIPRLEVDHRLAAGSFDGFEQWTVGSAIFRYAKHRIHVDTALSKPVISQFMPTIDADTRTESGVVTLAGGDATVTFDNPFHQVPVLTVTPVGTGNVTAHYSAVTTVDFAARRRQGGTLTEGDISYQAIGV